MSYNLSECSSAVNTGYEQRLESAVHGACGGNHPLPGVRLGEMREAHRVGLLKMA
jgi:hypothetical protein